MDTSIFFDRLIEFVEQMSYLKIWDEKFPLGKIHAKLLHAQLNCIDDASKETVVGKVCDFFRSKRVADALHDPDYFWTSFDPIGQIASAPGNSSLCATWAAGGGPLQDIFSQNLTKILWENISPEEKNIMMQWMVHLARLAGSPL
jgi:hypothetical protein